MVILDAMEKRARVRVFQTELNDSPGVCMKLAGALSDLQEAVGVAEATSRQMQVPIVAQVIPAPVSRPAYEAAPDFSPLIEQATVHAPRSADKKETLVEQQASFAIGFIETQGFTAVFEAIDTAVKTAAVEVLAREKLGGGYITVVIKGDVAAVTSAIDAGKAKVNGLGKLIAAHVIPSPSQGVLSLLPK
jgi:carbon dioxide concentrating mechanism protein CcmO